MKRNVRSPDSLNDDQQRILSIAALFEYEFNIDWIMELTGEKASQVFAALDTGIRQHWLASNRNGIFYFIDSIQRQKLQDVLPSDTKVNLHQKIADILLPESRSGAGMTKILAPHLLYMANHMSGCRVLIECGHLLCEKFQYDDAKRYYDKAIEDLKRLEGEEADQLMIDAALQYSKFATDNPSSSRTISIVQEAIDRAKSRNWKHSMILLEMNRAKSEWLCSRYRAAQQHFRKGWTMAEELGDANITRSVTIFSMFFHYWLGHFRDVVRSYEMFAPDVEDFSQNTTPLLAALTAGTCYGHCGQLSQGLGMLDAIRTRSRKNGNIFIAGQAGITLGRLLLDIEHFEEARQCIEESLEDSLKSRNFFSHIAGLARLSYVYFMMDKIDQATVVLREFVDLSKRVQSPTQHGPSIMYLCWAIEESRFCPVDGLSLSSEIDTALQGGNVFMKGIAYRYKAMLMKKNDAGDPGVIDAFKRSIRYLDESGHQIELAKSKIELAREYLRYGKKEKSREIAGQAVKILHAHNEAMVPDDIRPLAQGLGHDQNLLEQILHLGQELVSIRDSSDLFRKIISAVNRVTGAERGALFLLEENDPQELTLRAAKNLTSEDVAASSFTASMELVREACKTGKGRIVDFGAPGASSQQAKDAILSCICVPMIIRSKTVGVLYHDNHLFRSAFKESDWSILNYFAAQAAIAMDNAQAWKSLQTMYEKQQVEKQYYEDEYLKSIHSDDFIGKSAGIIKVFTQVEQVAQTDATVLILGETGVGKELVARSIHRRSSRRDKPFIRVHCSALPENLISTELFGHEKGAFTGAISRKIGRFELAHGGTLFLDEIGDISMEIQVRLLRVLQSKEFERVGGHETLHSDFRLLAATNRDLQKAVREGRFREDLFYRLNIFPIHIPPLRQRKEDILLLAYYFLKTYAAKLGKPVDSIRPPEMKKLLDYHWPGNVRELENVIERGLILSSGPHYNVPELYHLHHRQAGAEADLSHLSLKEMERNHIVGILKKTGGKITGAGGAAEILDIHPNTLYSRMKKLGIRKQADIYA